MTKIINFRTMLLLPLATLMVATITVNAFSMTPVWYNEVANPTARRIVYDDGPTEFIFATVGNNWPEFNDDISNEVKEEVDDSTAPEQQPRRTWNPIRRVGNLIRRIL